MLGGADQMPDRPGDLVGDDQPETDQRREHQQRQDRDDQREGNLQPGAVFGKALILRHRLLRSVHMVENRRVDRLFDHQHHRLGRVELDDRLLHRAVKPGDDRNLPGLRKGDIPLRRAPSPPCPANRPAGDDHLAGIRAENHRLGQPPHSNLLVQIGFERIRVAEEIIADLRQIARHRQRIQPDVVVMLGKIALRDLVALIQRRLDPLVEPGLNADN